MQPGPHIGAGLEPVYGSKSLQERFLGEILPGRPIAAKELRDAEHVGPVGPDELVEPPGCPRLIQTHLAAIRRLQQ